MQQCEQDRAGSGADIGDARALSRDSAFAKDLERQFDHGLGVRPRHQRRFGEAERQAPEFPRAENAGDRLMREPSCAYASSRAASSGVSCRAACVIRPVRSSPSAAPTSRRASRDGSSMPADCSRAVSARRAPSMLCPESKPVANGAILPGIVDRSAALLASTETSAFDRAAQPRRASMAAYDDQNIFAKILRGEIPCFKVSGTTAASPSSTSCRARRGTRW